ncbi:MAG: hypothetical protein JWO78_1872 [Micavibrio sp.]|nr:hypothetical protein [Micavibrio sp.]
MPAKILHPSSNADQGVQDEAVASSGSLCFQGTLGIVWNKASNICHDQKSEAYCRHYGISLNRKNFIRADVSFCG